jgi:redox-regulated HSP33 family molecular chaperone
VLFTEETKSLREVLDILTYPEKVEDQYITKILVDFYCRCSKERFAEKIVALGQEGTRSKSDSLSLVVKIQIQFQHSNKRA